MAIGIHLPYLSFAIIHRTTTMSGIFSSIASIFSTPSASRASYSARTSSVANSPVQIGFDRFTEVFAKHGMPYEAISTLFKTIDTDRDGKVTQSDVQRVMQRFERTKGVRTVDASQDAAAPFTDQHKQDAPASAMDETAFRSKLSDLQQQAATYSRNGARSFIATGIFINSFA